MTWYRWLRVQSDAGNLTFNTNTGTIYTKEDPRPITAEYLARQKMLKQATARLNIKGTMFKFEDNATKVQARDLFVVKYFRSEQSIEANAPAEFLMPTTAPKDKDAELKTWGSEKFTTAIVPIYDTNGKGIGWRSPGGYLHFHRVNGKLPKDITLQDPPKKDEETISEKMERDLKLLDISHFRAPILKKYVKNYRKGVKKCV